MNTEDNRNNKTDKIFEDALIRYMAEKYVEEEGRKIIEEANELNKAPMTQEEVEQKQKFEKMLDRELRKSRKKSEKFLLFYKIATAAAVLFIIFAVSVATVPAMRDVVLNFFTRTTPKYTEIEKGTDAIQFTNDDLSDDVYYREYEVTYLPEGFKTSNSGSDSAGIYVEYYDNNKNMITFEQLTDNVSMNVNTEGARIYTDEINGKSALISVKGTETITITWRVRGYFICLSASGVSEEEMLKVAKSVKGIE